MRARFDQPIKIGPYHLREGFHGKAIYFGIDIRTGQEVAMKEATPFDTNDGRDPIEVGKTCVEYEHSLQSRLRHPYISPATLYRNKGNLYLVTPDYGRESLIRKNNSTMQEKLQTLEDIAYALGHCHEQDIVHLDIKEENVMVRNGRGILIDFGAAREIGEPHPVTQAHIMCTEACAAPEYRLDGVYNTRTDSFSFSLMAYRTILNTEPFVIKGNRHILYDEPIHHPCELEDFGKLGELIIKGLAIDPKSRPSVKRIAEAFTELHSKKDLQPSEDSLALSPVSC